MWCLKGRKKLGSMFYFLPNTLFAGRILLTSSHHALFFSIKNLEGESMLSYK